MLNAWEVQICGQTSRSISVDDMEYDELAPKISFLKLAQRWLEKLHQCWHQINVDFIGEHNRTLHRLQTV